jgi:hypothetical protein
MVSEDRSVESGIYCAERINQEPRYIKYVPGAHFPTDLTYAGRVPRHRDKTHSAQ